ncbi:putative signal peptidase complex subunit 2 [Acorus calamus]|uniref:Signal peptidase complex subunit 2 n=1 Tax=Acorus calamus TaxID=4465 RepID=A0AAV9DDY1_ACOCL|nr:putative signal peptidase complex subunit 2 [Acorus calamus]
METGPFNSTGLMVSSKPQRFSDMYTLTIASADPKSVSVHYGWGSCGRDDVGCGGGNGGYDNSGCMVFDNRKDLIELVKRVGRNIGVIVVIDKMYE